MVAVPDKNVVIAFSVGNDLHGYSCKWMNVSKLKHVLGLKRSFFRVLGPLPTFGQRWSIG
ncbi:MAG: hypothetical protein EOO27_41770 [Comamonadaceae bacterium]|nr:MAG: hypothetical protein EOO27_41770 [Comamonadaceae bacterium]